MFVSAIEASPPKTKNTRTISLLFAGSLVVLLVSQLFSFEDWPAAILQLGLPGGETMARTIAALMVTFELLALPFLLAMRLSPAFRIVSMVCGWLVAVKWFSLTLWEVIVAHTNASILLGTTVPLPVGWWNVCIALALCVLAAWASWGMWPKKSSK